MDEFKVGDRVRLKDSWRWLQPLRGFAEKGRLATVEGVFVPTGCTNPRVRVSFDVRKGAAAQVHFLGAHDLELATPAAPAGPTQSERT